jgi:hypothetical protein
MLFAVKRCHKLSSLRTQYSHNKQCPCFPLKTKPGRLEVMPSSLPFVKTHLETRWDSSKLFMQRSGFPSRKIICMV